MDYYNEALEFFIENGVQLNQQQLQELADLSTRVNPNIKNSGKVIDATFNRFTGKYDSNGPDRLKKGALIGAGVTAAGLAGAAAYRKHKKAKEEEEKKRTEEEANKK